MYGLGTVLYYLIVGKLYNPIDEIVNEDQQEILEHINNVHPHALNLIEGMLNPDPEDRLTF